MLWTELTQEQQDLVKDFEDNYARPLAAKFKHDRDLFTPIMAAWFATVSPIVVLLDAGEVIPLTSSLAGAQALTKENLLSLAAWIDERNNDSFDQQLAVKAAGINANIQEVDIG